MHVSAVTPKRWCARVLASLIWLLAPGALLLADCSSSGSTTSSTSSTSSGSTLSVPLVQSTNNAKFGTILADSKGLTLYALISGGKPGTCHATDCTRMWPPLRVPPGGSVTGSPGVNGLGKSKSGTVVTYMGYPLSRYSGDAAPGQANGNGIPSSGGAWYVIRPGAKPAPVTS